MIDPERWLVLEVRPQTPDQRPLLVEGLLALGGAAVQEGDDVLLTYLLPPPDPEAFAAAARERLSEWAGEPADLEWRWQADEDWARRWKEGLAPRRVTPRLVVKPTWSEWDAAPGDTVIDIDPQMAFGTGEHATTRGCLRLLDAAVGPGDRVLDVGSGSSILAIAAVRLGAACALAVESDPDANLNARENLARNGVESQVRIVEAVADVALLRSLGSFDLVLANILSSVIVPLLPALRGCLAPSGRLVVSGILLNEAGAVTAAAGEAGLSVGCVDEEDEWWSALLLPDPHHPEAHHG
ncbi:hypothetical protein BH20GEM2_BH20GEM2_09220 [soil metagenome]